MLLHCSVQCLLPIVNKTTVSAVSEAERWEPDPSDDSGVVYWV